MNFGAARLGFNFNRVPNRGYKNQILCFYDPLTLVPESPYVTNYYDSGDISPAEIYVNVAARITALGFTPSLVNTFERFSSLDLSIYAHIWDLGYATPYATNVYNPTSKLYGYLQSGGAIMMLGENSIFLNRDTTIENFVSTIGGGTITSANTPYGIINSTVQPQFLLSNSNNRITFENPGLFTSLGNGVNVVSTYGPADYAAAMWKTNSLIGAPNGAVMSVLDVNVFSRLLSNDFIDNLILSLNSL